MSDIKAQPEQARLPQSRREFCAGACQLASGATLAALASGCSGAGAGRHPRPRLL